MKMIQLITLCVVIGFASFANAQSPYPLRTIQELQEPTDVSVTDSSDFFGDTVRVAGIAAFGPREIWIGGRFSFFLVDRAGGPWSGLQIVQNDSSEDTDATLMGIIEPGDSVVITGVMELFASGTQLQVLVDPITPIEILDNVTLGTFPQTPTLVSMADLQTVTTGEQYEETLVRLENVQVINNRVGGGEGLIATLDGGTQVSLEDWKDEFHTCLADRDCDWPVNSTIMNITGWIRDKSARTAGARYMIAPWSLGEPYIEILQAPPTIGDLGRDPAAPNSSDAVVVNTDITAQTTGKTATVNYSVDGGAFQSVAMTETSPDTFTGTIPAQAAGSLVRYYVHAIDDDDLFSISPADTSGNPGFYVVVDGGLSIQDVQFTPFSTGNSSYDNMVVTTKGIVTSEPAEFSVYWIQNGNGPWSGIRIRDFDNNPVRGDEVEVTGLVQERFGFTVIRDVTSYAVLNTGMPVPDPKVRLPGNITTGGDSAEMYEAVFVELRDVTVTNELPDAPSNFGEFSVGDESGSIRVDDGASTFDGNNPIFYTDGDTIDILRGYLDFAFGNFKLQPRSTDDVIGHRKFVSVREEGGVIPTAFELSQNYPNPFNPVTVMNYSLPVAGEVRLVVYNLLGQKITSLVDEFQQSGNYHVRWNGRDDFGKLLSSGVYFYKIEVDNGKFTDTKKMLLLK